MICVVGHVNHGKSTLVGHILYHLSPSGTFHKIPTKWSDLLDVLEEEGGDDEHKKKSSTHEFDIVTAGRYQFMDTPGHKEYLRSMIQGIGSTCSSSNKKIVLLVVSAKPKQFDAGWNKGGQIKEDIIVSRSMGFCHILVAVNKMDEVDYSMSEFNRIKGSIKPFLQSCKYRSIEFVPIVAKTGENLFYKPSSKFPGHKSLLNTVDDLLAQTMVSQVAASYVPPKLLSAWNKMKCEIIILNIPFKTIITKGFQCVVHYGSQEVEAEIFEILKPKGSRLIREKIPATVVIKSLSAESTWKILDKTHLSNNICLRYQTETIGFGKILSTLLLAKK